MPHALLLRKQILKALDEVILPSLRVSAPLHVLATVPFEFSQLQSWCVDTAPLPTIHPAPSQFSWHWPHLHMMATGWPFWEFVISGEAVERLGVTEEMAQEYEAQTGREIPGIIAVRLPSPAIVCIPAGVPRGDASDLYWDDSLGENPFCRMLRFRPISDRILVHLYDSDSRNRTSGHSLQINDPHLMSLERIYRNELLCLDTPDQCAAPDLLAAFMVRLRRNLIEYRFNVSNTSFPFLGNEEEYATPATADNTPEVCLQLINHIQSHLQDPLSLTQLSECAGMSPRQLNRLFGEHIGSTPMEYVWACRIGAARQMLSMTNERISDIARLTGFSGQASFSSVFRKSTGLTPTQYRRRRAHS